MGGLAGALSHHLRVGLDTSLFIYHLESRSRYSDTTTAIFQQLERGSFEGVTSVLTLMELAVKPLQLGRPDVADEYEILLANFPNLTIAQIDRAVARRAAELRSSYRLRPADALHVACTIEAGASAFLTNDRDLRRISDLEILILEDYVQAL